MAYRFGNTPEERAAIRDAALKRDRINGSPGTRPRFVTKVA